MTEILCSKEECRYYGDHTCSLQSGDETPEDALCYIEDSDAQFYTNTGMKRECYRCGKEWRGAVKSGPRVGSLCRECNQIVNENGIDYGIYNEFKQPTLSRFTTFRKDRKTERKTAIGGKNEQI